MLSSQLQVLPEVRCAEGLTSAIRCERLCEGAPQEIGDWVDIGLVGRPLCQPDVRQLLLLIH